jgi:hypothetical protein
VAKNTIGQANIQVKAEGLEKIKAQLDALKGDIEKAADAIATISQKASESASSEVAEAVQEIEVKVEEIAEAVVEAATEIEQAVEQAAESTVDSLDDVQTKTEEVAEASQSFGRQFDGAFGKVGKSIEDSTKGLRKFQGALSGIIGVVGGLGAIVTLVFGSIIRKIKETREEAEEFEKSLVSIGDKGREIAKSFRDIAKEEADELTKIDEKLAQDRKAINDANAQALEKNLERQERLRARLRNFEGFDDKNFERGIRNQLKQLEDAQQRANDAAEKQIQIIEREAEAAKRSIQDRIDARNREADAADLTSILDANRLAEELASQQIRDNERRRLEGLEGEQRIREELALETLDLQDKIREAENANNPRLVSALRERLAIEKEIADTRIQGIRDAQQAENARRDSDALARQLKRLADIAEDQVKALNDNTKTQEQLLRQVTIFTPDIRRAGDGLVGR